MSLAIAIGDSRLIRYSDYEPVNDVREVREVLRHTSAQERNYLEGSASDWIPTIDAAFRGIRDECQTADWDGQGAIAITDQVIAIAEKVVGALFELVSKGTPLPDLVPEADGEIAISWSVDSDRLLSLSVGAHGKINFAGQFGKEGGIHGWQPINAASPRALDESLQDVAKYLGRLYPPPVSKRAA
jgi:hypothetical protein